MKKEIVIVAQEQLDAAIDHFFNGDLVCAITLAGAAEELLGGLCKRSCIQSALDQAAKLNVFPSDVTARERKDALNSVKNALKHADRDGQKHIEIVEEEAYIMIGRAIYNLKALCLEQSQNVKRFCSRHEPSGMK